MILARSVRTASGAELVLPLRNGETISVATGGLSDDREPAAFPSTGSGQGTRPDIDSVSDITNSCDKFALVGRPAAFARVRVQRVAGTRSFWAGDSRAERVFVVVDALDLERATGLDRGLADGDVVSIEGTVERVPGTLGQVNVISWGRLDDSDAKALSDRDVYVYAKRVRVLKSSGAAPTAGATQGETSRNEAPRPS